MKDTVIPIDQAGRIVLPKHVREELAVKPGDLFSVSLKGAAVILTLNKEAAGFVRKGKALVFSTPGDEALRPETIGEMLDTGRGEHLSSLGRGLSGARQGKR